PLSPSFYILLHSSFFFNDPATPAFSTLSLHDALPISRSAPRHRLGVPVCAERSNFEAVVACSATGGRSWCARTGILSHPRHSGRTEEHNSELQSLTKLRSRLLLLKKKKRHEKRYSLPC